MVSTLNPNTKKANSLKEAQKMWRKAAYTFCTWKLEPVYTGKRGLTLSPQSYIPYETSPRTKKKIRSKRKTQPSLYELVNKAYCALRAVNPTDYGVHDAALLVALRAAEQMAKSNGHSDFDTEAAQKYMDRFLLGEEMQDILKYHLSEAEKILQNGQRDLDIHVPSAIHRRQKFLSLGLA